MEVDVDIPAVDKPSEDADNFDMLEVFLSPTPMLELDIEEDDVKKYFFDVLEKFICGDDPKEMFKKLSSLNSPQTTCGKVFKVGEPTYSCRDCGLDPTCVLCVDCFKVRCRVTKTFQCKQNTFLCLEQRS